MTTPKRPTPHPSGARPPVLPAGAVPKHVALVMDGNGRWAKMRGLPRIEGHKRGEAVLLDREALARSFTLKELVRLGAEEGPRPDDVPLDEWLAKVGKGRTPFGYLGDSEEDDIEDPIGRRFAVYKKVANEIESRVDELVDLAWPAPPA